jgi:ABC-type antimicrobial peptide transport system permease subunit
VLAQTGRFAIIGIVLGLASALAGARLISGLLFNTTTVDPFSVSVTLCAIAVIAALAAIIPAGRAASVSPTDALRAE